MNQTKQLLSFFIISIIAFLLLVVGLKLYFDDQRLTDHFEKKYLSSHLATEKGKKEQHSGKVYWGNKGDESSVSLKSLNIQLYWYKNLVIQFLDKDDFQSLELNIFGKSNGKATNIKVPILYTNNQTATINFDKLKASTNDLVITKINLSTPRVLETAYAIESLTFYPKPLSWTMFIHLLTVNIINIPTLFDDNKMFSNFNITPDIEIAPFNMIFLLYIFCFFVVSFAYKLWKKKKIEPFFVMLLSAIWIILDANLIKDLLFFVPKDNKKLIVFNDNVWLFGCIGIILWILGTALSANCLKKRYGYLFFNISLGFWLAVLILIVGAHFSEGLQKTIQSIGQLQKSIKIMMTIIMLLLVSVASFFIYKFIPSRLCTIDEHRLEEAPPNNHYFYAFLLIFAVIIHVVFIVIMNVNIPREEALTNLLFRPLALSLNVQINTILIIFYIATLLSLMMFFYGTLRYIGFSIINSCAYLYLLSSLPVWLVSWHALFIAYLIGAILIIVTIVIRYKEWRILLIGMLLTSLLIYVMEFMSSFSVLSKIILINDTASYLGFITSMLYSPWFSSLYFCVIISFITLFRLRLMSRLNDTKGIVFFYEFALSGLCLLGLLSYLSNINFIDNLISFSSVTIFLVLALPICYLSFLYKKDSEQS